MNGYLLGVIGTVLLSAILTAIIPEGKTAKTVKGMTKLACLLVIISPIPNYLKASGLLKGSDKDSLTNFPQTVIQTDSEFIKYYSEMRIRQTEEALEKEILDKYGKRTQVTLAWEEQTSGYDEIKITKIHVQTENGLTAEEANAMWEYLTKTYCSEVLIE